MKGENKKRRVLAEKRKNRRAIVRILIVVAIGPGLLIWMFLSFPQLGSPSDMVKSQIVAGKAVVSPSAQASLMKNSSNTQSSPFSSREIPFTNAIVTSGGRNYLSISFAQLASFPFVVTPDMADATADPRLASARTREQLPGAIQSLSDHSVAITGFMLPVEVESGVTSNFMLLRNQSACCYGIAPRVSEWVIVHTTGKGVKPIMDVPVTALGVLHVGEVREKGQLLGIYQLDCDRLLTKQ